MKYVNIIFQTKMFLVVLILLSIYQIFFAPTGFNQIISWGWIGKINHYLKLFLPFVLFFFVLSYGILSLLKREMHRNLSIMHVVTIILIITQIKQQNEFYHVMLSMIFFSLFFANIIISLKINGSNK